MNTKDVTRLEIIDHTMCDNCTGQGGTEDVFCQECGGSGMKGRTVIFWDENKQVDVELQDDNKTMKVFLHERYEE